MNFSSLSLNLLIISVLLLLDPQGVFAQEDVETVSQNEIRDLKKQVEDLADKIEHQDKHILHKEETSDLTHLYNGMEFGLGLTGVVQGSMDAKDLAGEDRTDASGSLDLEVEAGIGDRGTAFILMESRDGSGLTNEIVTLHGINADAIDENGDFRLTEAWYKHLFMNDRLHVTLGKVDLTNYFDTNAVANDETLHFLADGFVNSMAVEFPLDNGPGLRLTYHFNDDLEIGLGLGDSNADFEEIESGLFTILELDYKTSFQELEGNYRFYLWQNRSDHTEWKKPLRDRKENRGIGFSIDQAFHDSFTAFFRAAIQDESVSQVDYALSFGGEVRGLIANRGKDVFGVALGYGHLSDDYEKTAAPLETDHEQMAEVYYTFHVNDHLRVSPDLQIIRNPAGLGRADTITILGIRAQLLL